MACQEHNASEQAHPTEEYVDESKEVIFTTQTAHRREHDRFLAVKGRNVEPEKA